MATRKGRPPRTRSTASERREAVLGPPTLGLAGQPGPERWARILITGIRHYEEPGSVAE